MLDTDWGAWEWRVCRHEGVITMATRTTWIDRFGAQHGVAFPRCLDCGEWLDRTLHPARIEYVRLREPLFFPTTQSDAPIAPQ